MTLAACSGKASVSDDTSADETLTSISEETEVSLSLEEEKEPTPSAEEKEPSMVQEDENIYYYYSDNHSVCVRIDYDAPEGSMASIIDGDLEIPVDIETGHYGTQIEKIDIDSDGEGEYLISECEGTGTGFCIYGLVIVKKDGDEYTLTRYDSEYFSKILSDRITPEYNKEFNELMLKFEDSGQTEILPLPEISEDTGSYDDIVLSDILNVKLRDKKVWISAPLGIVYTERVVPDYDTELYLSAPVEVLSDLSLNVGNIRSYRPDYSVVPEDLKEKEIYHCYFDIDHDGIDDKISASLVVPSDHEGEINDFDFNGTFGYVKAVPGYTSQESEEILFSEDYPLWKHEYGIAHTGNCQIFATTVNHRSYIVYSSLYSGQGTSSYNYEVFFLDYTQGPVVYSVDSMSMDFDMEDESVDTSAFFDGLYKWINESSILLVATDVDLDPSVYYSTRSGVLNPDVYYSQRR